MHPKWRFRNTLSIKHAMTIFLFSKEISHAGEEKNTTNTGASLFDK